MKSKTEVPCFEIPWIIGNTMRWEEDKDQGVSHLVVGGVSADVLEEAFTGMLIVGKGK